MSSRGGLRSMRHQQQMTDSVATDRAEAQGIFDGKRHLSEGEGLHQSQHLAARGFRGYRRLLAPDAV
jgi:hypothetical protein